ncbi:MAG: hypothetical protein KDD48_00930 [Bdellovibrionales bacterium]|nr:hypothetical protein [Bdellovibrionales bacterium]
MLSKALSLRGKILLKVFGILGLSIVFMQCASSGQRAVPTPSITQHKPFEATFSKPYSKVWSALVHFLKIDALMELDVEDPQKGLLSTKEIREKRGETLIRYRFAATVIPENENTTVRLFKYLSVFQNNHWVHQATNFQDEQHILKSLENKLQ